MRVRQGGSRLFGMTIAMLGCAAILAAAALATTGSEERETYVSQAEPICKTNTKANERILSDVRKEIRQGKLGLAAGKFKRAAAAFGKATKELSAIPQPVDDQAKLTKWLGLLGKEKSLLSQIGQALKAGKKSRAQSLSVKLTHNGNAANNAVLGFEFNYCLINSSRFS
jgi:Flp pilus assembly protein TadD